MKTFASMTIGSLTRFIQAPHPDARMVMASHVEDPKCSDIVHAGWLMPQVGEVDEKTARFYEAKRRREARAIAGRVAKRWADARSVQVQEEGEAS